MKPTDTFTHRAGPAAGHPAPARGGRYLWAATVAVAATTGWMARGLGQPADAPAPALPSPAAAAQVATAVTTVDAAPLIAVASDGRVTLRVEQQPLDWVLEQIGQQSGRTELLNGLPAGPGAASAAAPVPAAASTAEAVAVGAACPSPVPPAAPAQLMKTIEHGTEADRLDALMQARAAGLALPGAMLKTLVETAPSDLLRLVALETWLDRQPEATGAQRAALQAALLVPNPAVQLEARQRLDDLLETERLDALAASGSP